MVDSVELHSAVMLSHAPGAEIIAQTAACWSDHDSVVQPVYTLPLYVCGPTATVVPSRTLFSTHASWFSRSGCATCCASDGFASTEVYEYTAGDGYVKPELMSWL